MKRGLEEFTAPPGLFSLNHRPSNLFITGGSGMPGGRNDADELLNVDIITSTEGRYIGANRHQPKPGRETGGRMIRRGEGG